MKASRVTVVPAFDLAEFAQETESDRRRPRITIVPTFNVEQYARAVASAMPVLADVPALEQALRTQECLPTSRPAATGTMPAVESAACEVVAPDVEASRPRELLESSLDERPVRCRAGADVTATLSHRAAFLLLHVDGVSTLREIVARCGIPREEALATLAVLLHRGMCRVPDSSSKAAPESRSGIRELGACAAESAR